MKNTEEKNLERAVELLQKWIDAIDSANNLIKSDRKDIKKVFDKRTSTDTYQSMQESKLYLEVKKFLYDIHP